MQSPVLSLGLGAFLVAPRTERKRSNAGRGTRDAGRGRERASRWLEEVLWGSETGEVTRKQAPRRNESLNIL